MLEILVLLAVLLGMANKPRRRKRAMGAYVRGNVEENLALGALGSGALITDGWDETVNEKSLISSIVSTWSWDAITAEDGPIDFGIAHSDYTGAEILEVLATGGSWDSGNLISQEVSRRKVRQIGTFVSTQPTGEGIADSVVNDGKPIKTKLNWVLQSGDGLQMWAVNRGSAVLVTGSSIKANGHANLWQK